MERWFHLHPKILQWHERVMRYLQGTQCWKCDNLDVTLGRRCDKCGAALGGTVGNKFGFRRKYFERIDESLLPGALAWIPQSTVAFCTELGWTSIAGGPSFAAQFGHAERVTYEWSQLLVEPQSYAKWHNVVRFLIQVHDSIVFQVPEEYEHDVPQIVKDMRVVVPYDDPLIIPMSFAMSKKSWGDCE